MKRINVILFTSKFNEQKTIIWVFFRFLFNFLPNFSFFYLVSDASEIKNHLLQKFLIKVRIFFNFHNIFCNLDVFLFFFLEIEIRRSGS